LVWIRKHWRWGFIVTCCTEKTSWLY
jgi:hypothetical protein